MMRSTPRPESVRRAGALAARDRNGRSSGAAGEAPLKPPVALDVRGLEPPWSMIAILEKLVELGPGAQLVVQHRREPTLLHEKLALRGYGARVERTADGHYLVHVAPLWAFRRGGA